MSPLVETIINEPGGLENVRVVLTYNPRKYLYNIEFNVGDEKFGYGNVDPTEVEETIALGVSHIREDRRAGAIPLVWVSGTGEVIGDVFLPEG